MIKSGTTTFEVTIPIKVLVTATGYSDRGRVTGKPENCYPAEGDMKIEKLVIKVTDNDPVLYAQLDQYSNQELLSDEAFEVITAAFFAAIEKG